MFNFKKDPSIFGIAEINAVVHCNTFKKYNEISSTTDIQYSQKPTV